jgi:hypothetical protein
MIVYGKVSAEGFPGRDFSYFHAMTLFGFAPAKPLTLGRQPPFSPRPRYTIFPATMSQRTSRAERRQSETADAER